MANMVEWVLSEAGEEPITGVVLGPDAYGGEPERTPKPPYGKLLTWKEARPYMDFEFNTGFGGPYCYAMYAWTPSKVITTGVYDGATWVYSIPRMPMDIVPEMQGG